MEVALDQRPTEEALLLSHERSFSHFVSCLLVSFPAAITSRRSKKSRETFAREFANFSTRSVARNDGARIIRAAISQSSRTRRSERLDARLISAIGGKSNEIYIVDTNQLASVHGSRGHESSVTSQPFRRSRRARNAGNQWCNPTALSLSLAENSWQHRGKLARMSRPIENAYNPDPRNFAAVNWQLRKTPPLPNRWFTRMTFFSAAHAWQKEEGERGKRNGRMGRAIGELFETRGPDSLPRLSLSLVRDTRRCALSAALRVTTQMHGGIMRRRDICTNEQHATCYARMIYRFTAQGYLILANYARW